MTDSSSKTTPLSNSSSLQDVDQLFSHWVKKESSSKAPGQFYYFNTKTKASVWSLDELVKEENLFEKQRKQIIKCLSKKNIKCKVSPSKSTHSQYNTPLSAKKRKCNENTESSKEAPQKKKRSKRRRESPERSQPKTTTTTEVKQSIHDSTAKPLPYDKVTKEEAKEDNMRFEPISFFGNDLPIRSEEADDGVELMEVDEVDPGILRELRQLRSSELPSPTSEEFQLPTPSSQSSSNVSSSIVVVIDTNVFISNLPSINKILESGHRVHVPWTVFRELDYLKESKRECSVDTKENLSYKARRAIDFLHKSLSSEDSKVSGQNGEEERESGLLFRASCPDDKILQCCLYLRRSYEESSTQCSSVLLYSNDKNLLNKALLNKIQAASSSTLFGVLCKKKKKESNLKSTTTVMTSSTTVQQRSSSFQHQSSVQTPYDLKKDIIDEAKDLTLQLLTNSLKEELIFVHGSSSKLGSNVSSSWSLIEAFRQVFSHWETLYVPLLKEDDSDSLKRELGIVESLLARPRPLNKVWNLIEECLGSLQLFNSSISSSRPAYYASCGRNVQIRIEMLLKRKGGVEGGAAGGANVIGVEARRDMTSEGNIYESFNSIWNYIYAYTTSYSFSCGLPLSPSIPPPKQIAFNFPHMRSEEISHLKVLTTESSKLANKLGQFLGVSGEELSTSSPLLLDLMKTMHVFIQYCSSFRPGGHPSADPLPKLVPRGLLQYSTVAETRARMVNGLTQLRELLGQLGACVDKLQGPK